MALKIGVIGDAHMDKSRILNVVGEGANKIMVDYIDSVIKKMVDAGVDYIVQTGDVGDEPSLSDESELLWFDLLHKWDGKVELHIYLGNHDIEQERVHALCKIEWMAKHVWKTIHVHTKYAKTTMGDLLVEFLPYPLKASQTKKPSICFGHFGRAGAVGDNGYALRGGEETAEGDNSLYILGHLHTPQKVGQSYFPGTLYQTAFGEPLPKGYAIFTINDKYQVKKGWWIEAEPPFKFMNVEINVQEDLDKVDKNLRVFQKLFCHADVVVPSNFMLQHPNVIDVVRFKSEVELTNLKEAQVEKVEYGITSLSLIHI